MAKAVMTFVIIVCSGLLYCQWFAFWPCNNTSLLSPSEVNAVLSALLSV